MRWVPSIVAGIAVAALSVTAPAIAQTPSQVDEYFREQKKGIDAIGASKHADGLAAFERCLKLLPNDATSAYNLGCVHSLKGELDAAIEWLGKAADWDFGALADDELQLFETKDTDLANVRKDPRFAPIVERVKSRRKAVADYVATPEIYVPTALANAPSVPLLVVLHDAGQTKTTALAKGPWKRLADELGFALLVPSARCMIGSEPAAGMRWFHYWFAYGDKPWIFEKSVSDAVAEFRKGHKVDSARTFIVGEGQGGMVAFSVAAASPGTYKGVVVWGSTIFGGSSFAAKARSAAKAGMKAKLLVPDTHCFSPVVDAEQIDSEVTAIEKLFVQWAMTGGVERFQRKSDDPDQEFTLVKAALQGFLPPSPPVLPGPVKDGAGE